jgi:hypothetical protein
MITKILVFDTRSKCELFKKWVNKTRTHKFIYTFDIEEAIAKIRSEGPDIILLGGDVNSEDYKAVTLWARIIHENLDKDKYVYISTWDPDEASVLRNLASDSLYCPFSESLANIVKIKASGIRKSREKKNEKNN